MEEANMNQIPMSKCLDLFPRTNSEVVCELSSNRRQISYNLDKLNKAISADPHGISEHHKSLWRKQAKIMQEYVDVLGERIKDLIDSDT